MLLHDIGKSPDATFKRINQHLETNYGFRISEDVSDKDLVAIMEQIEEEITDLKVKGDDAKGSSEISKRLLVLEGIKNLREYAMMQVGSPMKSPEEDTVIRWMIDFIVDDFKICGDFEESVRDAMKQYRSSRYRFPDDVVEQQARHGAMAEIHAASASMDTGALNEDAEAQGDSEMEGVDGLEEATPYGQARAGEHDFGMHGANSPDKEDSDDSKDQVIMVKDKHGRMVKDPWAAQRAARRKGIVMKEHTNLVKNLRRLLETEVSQAEVMMAAKGFAQELQEMVEKIGRLQNEDLPPVTDQMRETYGMESASAFQTQIYGALQSVMDALYTAKTQVDDAVSNMASTGQVSATTDMDKDVGMDGAAPDMGDDAGADLDMPDDLDNIGNELGQEPEDEFGGEEALGRSKKMESILQKKVMEMKKIVAKARKLREAKK